MAETTTREEPKHAGGRPLKYETVEELDRAIQNYFAEQDPHETKTLVETGRDAKGNLLYDTRNILTEQKPYTVSGLARAMGMTTGSDHCMCPPAIVEAGCRLSRWCRLPATAVSLNGGQAASSTQ